MWNQLTKTVNDLAKSLNKGQQVDRILLDFSKTVEIVWGKNFKWIENFLKKWTQQVVVEGAISSIALKKIALLYKEILMHLLRGNKLC